MIQVRFDPIQLNFLVIFIGKIKLYTKFMQIFNKKPIPISQSFLRIFVSYEERVIIFNLNKFKSMDLNLYIKMQLKEL